MLLSSLLTRGASLAFLIRSPHLGSHGGLCVVAEKDFDREEGFDDDDDDDDYDYDDAYYDNSYLDYQGVVADVTNAADAEFMHERALAAANQGNLQEALPLFKRAAELNPEKDTFWSNYGVTQMRLNMLDDALVSYTKGLRLNPTSSLIKENMKALKRKCTMCTSLAA